MTVAIDIFKFAPLITILFIIFLTESVDTLETTLSSHDHYCFNEYNNTFLDISKFLIQLCQSLKLAHLDQI